MKGLSPFDRLRINLVKDLTPLVESIIPLVRYLTALVSAGGPSASSG